MQDTMAIEFEFDSLKDLEHQIGSCMISMEKRICGKVEFDSLYDFLYQVEQIVISTHAIKKATGSKTVHFKLDDKHASYSKVRKDKDLFFEALIMMGALDLNTGHGNDL